MEFDRPQATVSFNRSRLIAGPSGITHPVWTATAQDTSGHVLSTVGEARIASYSDVPANRFTLTGPEIKRVIFWGDDHGVDGFCNVVIDPIDSTRASTSQSDSASLSDAMQVIANQVGAQGPINFQGSVHDGATNTNWSYTRTVSVTNFRSDPDACKLFFHFEETTSGQANTEVDGWIPFGLIQDIKVQSLEEELVTLDARAGHPQWQIVLRPEIWTVVATRGDGTTNDLDFYSRDTAMRVADAERRATRLCGGKGSS